MTSESPFCRPMCGPSSANPRRRGRSRSRRSRTTISRCCASIRTSSWRSCPRPIGRPTRTSNAGSSRRPTALRGLALPAFWTVEIDPNKEREKSYILTSGEADRPEKDHEVQPGWPFAPQPIDFREGRIEAFADWLTAPENPLFARVAVNRLWQWHFGEGLQKTPSDFGELGGTPTNPRLLDWLASEFVRRGFSMKAMHRLIVTSETYKLSTEVDPARLISDGAVDPDNAVLWHFRLRRLEAEPIWDSILAAAGDLDLSVGGRSFDVRPLAARGVDFVVRPSTDPRINRRAAYMIRGYSTSRDVMPNFLQAFDVDDGRAPCPLRTRTVAAPQSLFLMNSDTIAQATAKFAERLKKESRGDLDLAVDLAYRVTLTRPPSLAGASQCALLPRRRSGSLERLRLAAIQSG